jgi:hypothetical protein
MRSYLKSHKPTPAKVYKLEKKGSLGLLAYGHVGVRAWKKVKNESSKEHSE